MGGGGWDGSARSRTGDDASRSYRGLAREGLYHLRTILEGQGPRTRRLPRLWQGHDPLT